MEILTVAVMPWIPAIFWHWNKLSILVKPPKNKNSKVQIKLLYFRQFKCFYFLKNKDKNKYEPKHKGNPSVLLNVSEKD